MVYVNGSRYETDGLSLADGAQVGKDDVLKATTPLPLHEHTITQAELPGALCAVAKKCPGISLSGTFGLCQCGGFWHFSWGF